MLEHCSLSHSALFTFVFFIFYMKASALRLAWTSMNANLRYFLKRIRKLEVYIYFFFSFYIIYEVADIILLCDILLSGNKVVYSTSAPLLEDD